MQSRLQVASQYLQEGQPEAAMRHLKMAEDIDPDSPQLYEILALTLERMGDEDKVEKNFRKMLRLDGAYSRGRANYGAYLIRQGKFEEAYDQFTFVTQDVYYQNRTMAYQQLAYCAQQLGKNDEVIVAYQKALALDKMFSPALLGLAQFNFAQKKYPLSHEYFERYRESVKQSSPQALLLGIRLARVFRSKDEETSYAMALKNLYPKSQEYLDYLDMKNNQVED